MELTESEIRLLMKVSYDKGVTDMKVINKLKDLDYVEIIKYKERFFDDIIKSLPMYKKLCNDHKS